MWFKNNLMHLGEGGGLPWLKTYINMSGFKGKDIQVLGKGPKICKIV